MTFITTINAVFFNLIIAYFLSQGALWLWSRIFVRSPRAITSKMFYAHHAIGIVHGIGWVVGLLYAGAQDLAATTTFLFATAVFAVVYGVYLMLRWKRRPEALIDDLASKMVDYSQMAGK